VRTALVVLITSPMTCEDVVDLLYNLLYNTAIPQQIEVVEFALWRSLQLLNASSVTQCLKRISLVI